MNINLCYIHSDFRPFNFLFKWFLFIFFFKILIILVLYFFSFIFCDTRNILFPMEYVRSINLAPFFKMVVEFFLARFWRIDLHNFVKSAAESLIEVIDWIHFFTFRMHFVYFPRVFKTGGTASEDTFFSVYCLRKISTTSEEMTIWFYRTSSLTRFIKIWSSFKSRYYIVFVGNVK